MVGTRCSTFFAFFEGIISVFVLVDVSLMLK